MDAEKPIRVLIVDDHVVLRDGLKSMIERQPDMAVAGEAGRGDEAVELFRQLRPSVTIMDLRLPGLSGIDALTAIRKEFPEARILVLTTYDRDEDIYRALDAGARGYLLKDATRDELVAAIRAVHAGRRCIPAALAERLMESGPRLHISDREMDVLRLVAKGLRNKEIASELGLTEGTVKGYIINILRALDAHDRTKAVSEALRRGLLQLD